MTIFYSRIANSARKILQKESVFSTGLNILEEIRNSSKENLAVNIASDKNLGGIFRGSLKDESLKNKMFSGH
jgi:hypothetical protein